MDFQQGVFDPYEDHNKIVNQILIKHIFKIFRIAGIALCLAYLTGIIWWIFVEIEILNEDYFQYGDQNFIAQSTPGYFFSDGNSDSQYRNIIGVFYFAFTTLTTVGFGDLRPYSTVERIFNAIILFGGVMIFSYIIGNFLNVIDAYKEVGSENEHADDLSRFFGIL